LRLNRERGMSVVYTSHYMEEVELLCHRVAIMDQGKIIAMDTVKNLVAMLGEGVIQIGLQKGDEALLADLTLLPAVKSAAFGAPPMAPPPAEGEEPKEAPATAEPSGVLVKIEVEDSGAAMVNIFGYFNERDISFTSVEILEPNLESVFLHLTGKKLRE